ncbi:MAG: surface protein, partial [Flavobacterium sp.]
TSFNQNIGSWNTSNVTLMNSMFQSATSFNQNIGLWNVGNVINMSSMFRSANLFNQNIGTWNVGNVVNMTSMLAGVTLSTANYDALLIGWNSIVLKPNVVFNAGSSKYCNGVLAKQNIVSTKSWTITDGGVDSTCTLATESFLKNKLSVVVTKNNTIEFLSSDIEIDTIEIYDLSGRLLFAKRLINNSEYNIDNSFNASILLIRTTMINGNSELKKLFNN